MANTTTGVVFHTGQYGQARLLAYDDGTGADHDVLPVDSNGGVSIPGVTASVFTGADRGTVTLGQDILFNMTYNNHGAMKIGVDGADALGPLTVVGSNGFMEVSGISSTGGLRGDGGVFMGGGTNDAESIQGDLSTHPSC